MLNPVFEKVTYPHGGSVNVFDVCLPYFTSPWHFHPEVEIIHILEGTGTLFIGDAMYRFSPGALALIGEKVPHVWLNDREYYAHDSTLQARSHVIKFKKNFWGDTFSDLPEIRHIHQLIENASRGIIFEDSMKNDIAELIACAMKEEGISRLINLVQILKLMTQCSQVRYLSSVFFPDKVILTDTDYERIDKIYRFLLNNFHREIKLSEISEIACMNTTSVCRYFKSRTLKTISEVLKDIRISFACKLLTDTKLNISEICFSSGFNYLSNFYKQFEQVKSMTPGEYRKAVQPGINKALPY